MVEGLQSPIVKVNSSNITGIAFSPLETYPERDIVCYSLPAVSIVRSVNSAVSLKSSFQAVIAGSTLQFNLLPIKVLSKSVEKDVFTPLHYSNIASGV